MDALIEEQTVQTTDLILQDAAFRVQNSYAMAPFTTGDLIFSEQANHNFSKTLGELKRHNLSISNRLSSIVQDAAFVQKVKAAWQRPLIANERCGSWYIEPSSKDGSAYFKSTDGHTGVWKFSTRRLNLHLLKAIGEYDGCIIIDSTRKGKKMPDALSKTIPIWCAVLNRALFPDQVEYHSLYVAVQVVSLSEHSQITSLLDGFLKSFLELDLDLVALRSQISKPLRSLWVTPETTFDKGALMFTDYHTIVCCTASQRLSGMEVSESGYIQGAGDDTENWACGLTPPVFWANPQLLLSTDEADLPDMIAGLVTEAGIVPETAVLCPVAPTSSLYVTTLSTLMLQPPETKKIEISLKLEVTTQETWQTGPLALNIGLGPHKVGSRNLRLALPFVVGFVAKSLAQSRSVDNSDIQSITIACSSGKDHSIGIALTLLCLFYDDQGQLLDANEGQPKGLVDKTFIKRRLGWIMTAMPDANPSRSTLQSVNSYLIDRPS